MSRSVGRRVRRAVIVFVAKAAIMGCYDYTFEEPSHDDIASPETTRVDGDWRLLSDGTAIAAVQRFFHDRFGATVPTPSGPADGACEPSMPCQLWLHPPSDVEWEQVPFTNSRKPVTYDLIVFAPTESGKSHVAIVDHVEGKTIFVMDADARGDLRRARLPHAWRASAYGWFHLRKLDETGSPDTGSSDPPGGPDDDRTEDGPSGGGGPSKRDAGGGGNAGNTPDASVSYDCVPNGYYCGGNKLAGEPNQLYRCNGDRPPTLMARCANGCIVKPAGQDDECAPPTPCVVGGDYCGGDKINGEPDVLYECREGGAISILRRCAKGCLVVPGQNDRCAE